jgi:NAD(P)-dependent dehydrogenase (short-subunit alcohol dehydrogenase family)
MKNNSWGRIVTIGSVQEKKPHPDMLIYSSTKAALTLMAQSLALNFADSGVTVNSIAPGVIVTDRNADALANQEYAKQVKDKIPVGYFGDPESCAGIVSFLCSDKAHYITGQNIFVDGGMGIK